MAAGTIATSVLTDIANAIRWQNGTSTLYRPSEMAAAVAALDGTRAGAGAVEPYKELESGVVSSRVFEGIADAIRRQNGSADTYEPGDMAAAIRALSWDTGVKARALLLTDGTLEFNYRDGRSSDVGTVSQAWEVDAAGYSTDTARPWHAVRGTVGRVVFDADFAGAGVTNLAHWCRGMSSLTEVRGFETCSGATNVAQCFASCGALESIYATSFDNTAIASATSVLYGCTRLVGQTGYVAPYNAGAAALSLGGSGVLTDPASDGRTWVWAHLYEGDALEITASPTPDPSRTALASGRLCANARYCEVGFVPWWAWRSSVASCAFMPDVATLASLNIDYWFYNDIALSSVTGWGNVRGLSELRHSFNGCKGLVALDLAGLDPSALTDLTYTFSGCSNLTAIYADATWALPAGVSGFQTFYGCSSLVGGAGTAYSSSAASYARMVIDAAGTPGYLTARA